MGSRQRREKRMKRDTQRAAQQAENEARTQAAVKWAEAFLAMSPEAQAPIIDLYQQHLMWSGSEGLEECWASESGCASCVELEARRAARATATAEPV